MANIKNFGLVGVGSDVQFGKSGPRLINETGIFKFKKADGIALADAHFANVTADELKSGVGKLVTVDAAGKLVMGTVIDELAVKTQVAADIAAAVLAEEQRALAAEEVIADAVAAEKTRAEAAEAALQDAIEAIGETVSGDLSEAIAAEETRAKAEEARIEALVVAEKARAEAAELVLTNAVAAEKTRAEAAELVLTNALAAEVTRATAEEQDIRADFASADAAIRQEMQAAIAGLAWENPVDHMVADLDARDALTLVTGARIFVEADKTIYTKTADGFDAGELMVEGAAFFDKETTVPYVFNGTDMVQFNGASGLTAGLGLILNGNTMDLDLSPEGGLKFYPDAGNPNNTVGLKLADSSLEVGTTGLQLSAALQTEITKLRTDLTADQGALAAEILRATGIEGGLETRLAAAELTIVDHTDRIVDLEAKTSADSGALQLELDKVEAAIGLNADGTLAPFTSINFIAADDTFAAAVNKIDAALKAMDVAYKAADAVVLADAKEYADGLDAAMLEYVDGKIVLVTEAIANAKAEAIAAAALDATTKANQALADSKIYTDSKISDQIGAANAARAVYAAFDGVDAVIGMVKGFVHRIKVYMTAAGATDSLVQVGTSTVNNQLATTADVDSSVAGLYTIEVNEVFVTETELKVFVGGAAAGKVVVEYLA